MFVVRALMYVFGVRAYLCCRAWFNPPLRNNNIERRFLQDDLSETFDLGAETKSGERLKSCVTCGSYVATLKETGTPEAIRRKLATPNAFQGCRRAL